MLYSPIDSELLPIRDKFQPKTCFLMTTLGKPIPDKARRIRRNLEKYLGDKNISLIDAGARVTGKDFLLKIWKQMASVPLGIGILTEGMRETTIANVFYEIGALQALGKETLIIRSKAVRMPTDLVRTEHITYGRSFKKELWKFLQAFNEQGEHYFDMSEQLEGDVHVSLDYLKRAYLIRKRAAYKRRIETILRQHKGSLGPYEVDEVQSVLKS